MPKKRRLTDLYIVGKEETFDDGAGDPITVYVRKLNPVDHETALRRANAARSRTMSLRSTPDSDEYQAMRSIVYDYKSDALVSYLIQDLRNDRQPIIEARVEDDEQWSKENYLQGLRDAWDEGLKERFEADPSDAEASQVAGELDRFKSQVDAELENEIDDLDAELSDRTLDDLRDRVFDKILDVRASLAWLEEFRKCEIWLSVRDADRRGRYFGDRSEIDELETEVLHRLLDAYREIAVEPLEGKDSAATPASSPSSDQSEKAETDESSGPQGAAA